MVLLPHGAQAILAPECAREKAGSAKLAARLMSESLKMLPLLMVGSSTGCVEQLVRAYEVYIRQDDWSCRAWTDSVASKLRIFDGNTT